MAHICPSFDFAISLLGNLIAPVKAGSARGTPEVDTMCGEAPLGAIALGCNVTCLWLPNAWGSDAGAARALDWWDGRDPDGRPVVPAQVARVARGPELCLPRLTATAGYRTPEASEAQQF